MRRAMAAAVAAVAAAGVMAGGAMIWQSQARAKASEAALPEVAAILTSAPLVPPPVDRPGARTGRLIRCAHWLRNAGIQSRNPYERPPGPAAFSGRTSVLSGAFVAILRRAGNSG